MGESSDQVLVKTSTLFRLFSKQNYQFDMHVKVFSWCQVSPTVLEIFSETYHTIISKMNIYHLIMVYGVTNYHLMI